jgi:hypothetical protein
MEGNLYRNSSKAARLLSADFVGHTPTLMLQAAGMGLERIPGQRHALRATCPASPNSLVTFSELRGYFTAGLPSSWRDERFLDCFVNARKI